MDLSGKLPPRWTLGTAELSIIDGHVAVQRADDVIAIAPDLIDEIERGGGTPAEAGGATIDDAGIITFGTPRLYLGRVSYEPVGIVPDGYLYRRLTAEDLAELAGDTPAGFERQRLGTLPAHVPNAQLARRPAGGRQSCPGCGRAE